MDSAHGALMWIIITPVLIWLLIAGLGLFVDFIDKHFWRKRNVKR
jgi:hypothetical protein